MISKCNRKVHLSTTCRNRADFWEEKLKENGIEYERKLSDIMHMHDIKFEIPEDKIPWLTSVFLIPYDKVQYHFTEI